jgi:hypothetical protein
MKQRGGGRAEVSRDGIRNKYLSASNDITSVSGVLKHAGVLQFQSPEVRVRGMVRICNKTDCNETLNISIPTSKQQVVQALETVYSMH